MGCGPADEAASAKPQGSDSLTCSQSHRLGESRLISAAACRPWVQPGAEKASFTPLPDPAHALQAGLTEAHRCSPSQALGDHNHACRVYTARLYIAFPGRCVYPGTPKWAQTCNAGVDVHPHMWAYKCRQTPCSHMRHIHTPNQTHPHLLAHTGHNGYQCMQEHRYTEAHV